MENFVPKTDETPNSNSPDNASIETLSRSFGILNMRAVDNFQDNTNFFGLSDVQEPIYDNLPQSYSFHPDNISANNSPSIGGSFLCSSNQQSMVPTNYTNGHRNNYQENNLVGNPPGDNAATVLQGGSNYMFNNNFQSDAIGGETGVYLGNGLGNSGNQQSLNYVGFHGNKIAPNYWLQGYKILMLARTEIGSHYLQSRLTMKDPKFTKNIIEGVFEFIYELLVDQYGHHLVVKVFESCNQHQLLLILAKMTSLRETFIISCLNKYGAKCIKRLIKILEKSQLVLEVISILTSAFFGIMTDQTGSYVIIKCLDILDTHTVEPLYEAAIDHCIQLATDVKGCISLNNVINSIKGPLRNQLIDLISSHAVYLSKDPSGNYVVQHVLALQNPLITKKIFSLLKCHYIDLSFLKCGSHVVEKCLRSPLIMEDVVKELLDSKQLIYVANDKYGNYVIQRALKVTKLASSPLHQTLLMKLQSHFDDLLLGNGRNILNLMKEISNN